MQNLGRVTESAALSMQIRVGPERALGGPGMPFGARTDGASNFVPWGGHEAVVLSLQNWGRATQSAVLSLQIRVGPWPALGGPGVLLGARSDGAKCFGPTIRCASPGGHETVVLSLQNWGLAT